MDRLAVLEQVVQNQNKAIKELKAEIETMKATRDKYILIGILERELAIFNLEIHQSNTYFRLESLSSFYDEAEVLKRQARVKEELSRIVELKEAEIEALKAEVEDKETE